jgi:TolB-like protein
MAIWTAEIRELEKLYESLKGKFPDLEKELERLIKADDENMILLYSRRCLEIIITDLCECELKRPRKTEPLKGIIDKLHKEEKVPPYIITSMHGLNDLSTYGTHPKDFVTEQIKPVLNNLDIIIKWYLKYKESRIDIKAKPFEEIRHEIKSAENVKRSTTIPKKKLIGLISGMILLVAFVVAVLFFTKIIGGGKQTKAPDKSIAVIPFRDLSNDTTQLYFSDGFVEAILDHLFKVGELKVISFTSTKRYRDTELSIKEIARELGVASILEGSVQKIGNNVRITAQLIDARTDVHLWSETYDRNISDIFSIQSEVAQNVARELKATLTADEKEQIRKNPTENTDAYNLYLQGRFFWYKRTEEALKKSVEYFEKSVAEDPEYALAYAGLADSYYILSLYGWVPHAEGFSKAKGLAYHALELDKNLAEAHTTLGNILYWSEWNWDEARKELVHAIELNPNYSVAYMTYSELLDIIGQTDEAIVQIKHAIGNDPLISLFHVSSAIFYYNIGKNKESLEECVKTIEISPDLYQAQNMASLFFQNYIRLGEGLKAVEVLQKNRPDDKETIKEAYSKSGTNGLFKYLIELQLKEPKPSSFALAHWYAMLGRKEEALDWLEKAFEEHYIYIMFIPRINCNPDFDNIRSEPRFQEIIKKMGLSEYTKTK